MTCEERYYAPGDFRSTKCGNLAKWKVLVATGTVVAVCGVHVRRYRRFGRRVAPL